MEKFIIDRPSNAVSEEEKKIEKRRENYSSGLKEAVGRENLDDHGLFKMLFGKGISVEDVMLEEAYSYNDERSSKKELMSSGRSEDEVAEIIKDMDRDFSDIDLRIKDGASKKIKIFRIEGFIKDHKVKLAYFETDPPEYKGSVDGKELDADEAKEMVREYKEFAEKKRDAMNKAKK